MGVHSVSVCEGFPCYGGTVAAMTALCRPINATMTTVRSFVVFANNTAPHLTSTVQPLAEHSTYYTIP
jgi:hypothetical protein